MTGRDLIIYILKNNLEDQPIFKDGIFAGMMSTSAAAEKLGAGVETIHALVVLGVFDPIEIGGEYFFSVEEIDRYLDKK